MPLEVKPIQNAPPTNIGQASSNPEATRWPAENRINIISNNNAETVRKITDAYRREWEGLGYDPEELPLLGMTRFVVISETDEKALVMGGACTMSGIKVS